MLTGFIWIAYLLITPRMDALEVLFLHNTKKKKLIIIYYELKLILLQLVVKAKFHIFV